MSGPMSATSRKIVTAVAMTATVSWAATLATVQAQAEPEDDNIIVVTGTAIGRIEGETSLPVQVLDAEAIEKTGASSVVDLIQRLPTMQGATMEADSVGAATFGFAGVSLHNVGENRTLV